MLVLHICRFCTCTMYVVMLHVMCIHGVVLIFVRLHSTHVCRSQCMSKVDMVVYFQYIHCTHPSVQWWEWVPDLCVSIRRIPQLATISWTMTVTPPPTAAGHVTRKTVMGPAALARSVWSGTMAYVEWVWPTEAKLEVFAKFIRWVSKFNSWMESLELKCILRKAFWWCPIGMHVAGCKWNIQVTGC